MKPFLRLLLRAGLRLCQSADEDLKQNQPKRLGAITSRAAQAYERTVQGIDRLYQAARSEDNRTLTKALGLLIGVGIGAGAGLLLASSRQTDSENSIEHSGQAEKLAEPRHVTESDIA